NFGIDERSRHARLSSTARQRQGPRDVRAGRPHTHGRLRPDLDLRRDPPDAHPAQGRGADRDLRVLVRQDRADRPEPRRVVHRWRAGPGARARDAGRPPPDVPGRVRRARLHHRLGLEGLSADRRRLRDRAPGGPPGVRPPAGADLHPGHQGRDRRPRRERRLRPRRRDPGRPRGARGAAPAVDRAVLVRRRARARAGDHPRRHEVRVRARLTVPPRCASATRRPVRR
ncbi:MAG: hypothetical protein QOH38_87, partial [Thermoleophilaceae bacterium]|nr:hypothetical protein [Thermoleophilaceae bacterium]